MKSLALATALSAALAGTALAAPVTFVLDKSHQYIGFEISHFGYSDVVGRFTDVEGTFTIDEASPENSSIEFVIQADSIDTLHQKRDDHLRSADFLDVEKFPTILFGSTSVDLSSENTGQLHGELTMLGETKPVVLDFVMVQDAPFPLPNYNNVRTVGFEARGVLKRSDWGLDTFVGPIGDDVILKFNFDVVLCEGEAAQAPSCTYGR